MKFGKTPVVSGALALQAVREVGSCVSLSKWPNCEPVPFLLEIKKKKKTVKTFVVRFLTRTFMERLAFQIPERCFVASALECS